MVSARPRPLFEQAKADPSYVPYVHAYRWLEKRIGHWPMFVAVGSLLDGVAMGGYAAQWGRILSSRYDSEAGKSVREYVPAGGFESRVMFSWTELDDVSFSNYSAWHWVLNGAQFVTPEQERKILRPERTAENWLHAVRRPDGPTVQGHVPRIDYGTSKQIWCRSQAARKVLIERGFDSAVIQVKRLPVDCDGWQAAIDGE